MNLTEMTYFWRIDQCAFIKWVQAINARLDTTVGCSAAVPTSTAEKVKLQHITIYCSPIDHFISVH